MDMPDFWQALVLEYTKQGLLSAQAIREADNILSLHLERTKPLTEAPHSPEPPQQASPADQAS